MVEKFLDFIFGQNFNCYFGGSGPSSSTLAKSAPKPPPPLPSPPTKEVAKVSEELARQNRRRYGLESTILGGAQDQTKKSVLGA